MTITDIGGVRVGHWGGLEDVPLFIFEGRLGYKFFSSGKLEGRLTVPLPHHFQFVGGIATDPLRLGPNNTDPTRMSARLEYVFGRTRETGVMYRETRVMYIGAQSGAHEFMLATGFIFDW